MRTLQVVGLVSCIGAAGCGGKAVVDGQSGGTGGAATTTGGAGGMSTDGGGMCNAPPPPSPTLPDQDGCYENHMGSGWVPVPCLCELWLENTAFAQITACSASDDDACVYIDRGID